MDQVRDAGVAPLLVSRVFAGSGPMLFCMWGSAAHIKQWFCPHAFTVPEAEVDFRAAGVFAVRKRADAYGEHCIRGVFGEVMPSDRLVISGGVFVGGAERFRMRTVVDLVYVPGRYAHGC